MAFAVELLEHEGERRAGCDVQFFFQLKDRAMRLALAWVNAPRGLLVAVERVRDGPLVLVEIGGRIRERDRVCGRRAGLEGEDGEFAQVQVAIVHLPTGAVKGEGIVSEHFETHGREIAGRERGGDRIDIALGHRAAREQRVVRLARERRATGGDEGLRLDDAPRDFARGDGADRKSTRLNSSHG